LSFSKAKKTLDPPICRACEVPMAWYRADLKSAHPKVITNFFACSRCDAIAVVDDETDRTTAPVFLGDEPTASEKIVWLAHKHK
jgi:hypothetical protein